MTPSAHYYNRSRSSTVRDEKVKEVVNESMIIVPIITAVASACALIQAKRSKQERVEQSLALMREEEILSKPAWLRVMRKVLKHSFVRKAEMQDLIAERHGSRWAWSETTEFVNDHEFVHSFLKSSCNFWSFLLFGMALAYLSYACITNLIACYRFFRAWNTSSSLRQRQISRRRSNVHEFYNPYRTSTPTKHGTRKPRPSYQDILQVQEFICVETGTDNTPSFFQRSLPANILECRDSQCPICMCDFEEKELVTSCRHGCSNWFHKDCLFEWLDRSLDCSCPCCRVDMLAVPKTQAQRSVLKEFSSFLGYYSH